MTNKKREKFLEEMSKPHNKAFADLSNHGYSLFIHLLKYVFIPDTYSKTSWKKTIINEIIYISKITIKPNNRIFSFEDLFEDLFETYTNSAITKFTDNTLLINNILREYTENSTLKNKKSLFNSMKKFLNNDMVNSKFIEFKLFYFELSLLISRKQITKTNIDKLLKILEN